MKFHENCPPPETKSWLRLCHEYPFCIFSFCDVSHAVVSGTYPSVAVPQAWSKVLVTVGWVWWRHQMGPLFSLASGPPNLKPTTGMGARGNFHWRAPMTYFMTSSFVKFVFADSQRSRVFFPVVICLPAEFTRLLAAFDCKPHEMVLKINVNCPWL